MLDKAYKILASKHNLSHSKAKELIDKGLVLVNGKRLNIARAEIPTQSSFVISHIKKPSIIFEDDKILAIDKPPFVESYDLCGYFKGWELLHRLDRETSGVILLCKSDFFPQAKEAFKKQQVYKEYVALANGIITSPQTITKPISTTKKGFAKSKIDKNGLSAITDIEPIGIIGKKTLLKVIIKTGRTHQIRVHLQSIGHPIVGDRIYGLESKKNENDKESRILLHAHKIALLNYEFTSPLPKELCL